MQGVSNNNMYAPTVKPGPLTAGAVEDSRDAWSPGPFTAGRWLGTVPRAAATDEANPGSQLEQRRPPIGLGWCLAGELGWHSGELGAWDSATGREAEPQRAGGRTATPGSDGSQLGESRSAGQRIRFFLDGLGLKVMSRAAYI
jgi:hypothetical protein